MVVRETAEPEVQEARENLRVIRALMERSTKHSTFSGPSGVFAGAVSIAGCFATSVLPRADGDADDYAFRFLLIWVIVIVLAVGADYLLTKRHAARVGKRILSRLGKQMVLAAAPGLCTGALLTLYFLRHHLLADIYPVWMLCYGIAVSAVGLFSQREVSLLGVVFLVAGAVTLLLPPTCGLPAMAATFGGLHIVYGIAVSRKVGW